jgi:hypothetical protein
MGKRTRRWGRGMMSWMRGEEPGEKEGEVVWIHPLAFTGVGRGLSGFGGVRRSLGTHLNRRRRGHILPSAGGGLAVFGGGLLECCSSFSGFPRTCSF